MNDNFSRLLRSLFVILDVFVLNISFFTTKVLFASSIPSYFDHQYVSFSIFCNVAWLASAWIYSIYQGKYTGSFTSFSKRSFHACFLFFILCLGYLYFIRQTEISRSFSICFLISFPVCLLINRLLYLASSLYFRKKEYIVKRVLIIGHNSMAKKLASFLENSGSNIEIVGFCEDEKKVSSLSQYPILCPPQQAIQMSIEQQVNEIYSTILPEQDSNIYSLMHEADQACIRFKLVPDLSHFVKRPMHVHYLADIPVLSSRPEPLDDLANRIKKRMVDIFLSSLVIIFVLSWLVPILGLLIWLESRGPIFFIQKRSGVSNKPFGCIKFRSMRVNKDSDRIQTTKHDNRLTTIGKFIRKTNIDEFPQFLNVFMGDMSVVGPRPHMLKHTEDYSKMYDQYMVRQFLKPGITGWAQTHGYRGEINSLDDIRNRVEHDIWYMENWNHWLDMKIMALTARNMMVGEEKAY